ncbi:hypothetical protein L596_019016 [Steinernema carpocapsae]|uniref:Uncharacterized protein n=1 Tax=Steinernema carpocapsae TaxID=34508 RepID=A0A4U5N755_STECR|nr:hypothetical protein L596_019016 [Steinernema carpocapsae]
MLPKVKEAFERIQREKAQSELLNEVQQHIIQNGGDLDADKAVEVLATKDNFEDVDIRTLTIGSSESTNPEQKTNDEGILEKVKSVAMLAIDALTADADEREKADENSRRSSSELNDEDKLLLEKIKKEKEQSELLNKVQKKKIRNLEQTFDPVQAQDNLRRQEQGKKKEKPVRKNSKSGCPREKSVDKKPVVAEGARVRKDSLKRADGSAKPKSRPTSRAPLPRA